MKLMKRNTMMMLALVGMTAGIAVNAETTQNTAATPVATAPKAQTQVAMPAAAINLSADEQAFVAKLNDQNRKAFSEKLSIDQKKSAIIAVKNGANADEAVQKIVAAKEVKDIPSIANTEKTDTADQVK